MSKKLKFLGLVFLTLALVVGVGASSANATLTLGALTVTSSGTLTLSGAAASAITIGDAAQTGTISVGDSTGAMTMNLASGNSVKTINLGTGTGIKTIHIGDDATPVNVITIGGAASNLVLTDAQWGVTGPGAATFVTVNGNTITTGTGTLTLAASSSLITSGAFAATLTSTATTNATLPAGTNTLYSTLATSITSAQLLSSMSDKTGTGLAVFATAPTFATSITGSYLTASEILGTDASKNIVSLAVATYPSLTELSYVKGLTSAVQTQLGLKAPLASPTFTGTVTLPSGQALIAPALGTPASGVLTNVTGLPTAGLVDGAVTTAKEVATPFVATATITSAAAATPVELLADSAVPAGKKVYVTGFHAKVNGGTLWATTATVKIQDTNVIPVDFFTMAVAALTANAEVRPGTANITSEAAYLLGTAGTIAKGLRLLGNANGTGSDLVVTVYGVIK
jgi:hypothetical protein